jgi:hypothetical protein
MLIGMSLAASALLAPARRGVAQITTRGQPRTPLAVADFGKLRWLEGTWAGTSDGGRDFFERLRFIDDTTADITYYSDSTFAHETGTGRLYLSVGHIYHTMGPSRWGVTNVEDGGVYFVPQSNTQASLLWHRQSKDDWTATMRVGFVGRDRVTVYHMRRTRP